LKYRIYEQISLTDANECDITQCVSYPISDVRFNDCVEASIQDPLVYTVGSLVAELYLPGRDDTAFLELLDSCGLVFSRIVIMEHGDVCREFRAMRVGAGDCIQRLVV